MNKANIEISYINSNLLLLVDNEDLIDTICDYLIDHRINCNIDNNGILVLYTVGIEKIKSNLLLFLNTLAEQKHLTLNIALKG